MTTLPRVRAEELREAAGGDADAVDPDEVVQLLRYPEREVQRHAAAALLAVVTEHPSAGVNAVDRLAHLLSTLGSTDEADADPTEVAFGETLLLCLARVATAEPERVVSAGDPVVDRLPPGDPLAAAASVCALQLLEADPAAFVPHVERFTALLDADGASTRRHAAHALTELAATRPAVVAPSAAALRRRLDDEDTETVQKAASALGRVARVEPAAVAPALSDVLPLLDHRERGVRANAAGVLADVAEAEPGTVARHVVTLCDSLADDAVPVRRNVATALVRVMAERDAVTGPVEGGLIELLDDQDPTVRALACRAIGHIQSPAALELLRSTAQCDPEPAVRKAARWAIRRIAE